MNIWSIWLAEKQPNFLVLFVVKKKRLLFFLLCLCLVQISIRLCCLSLCCFSFDLPFCCCLCLREKVCAKVRVFRVRQDDQHWSKLGWDYPNRTNPKATHTLRTVSLHYCLPPLMCLGRVLVFAFAFAFYVCLCLCLCIHLVLAALSSCVFSPPLLPIFFFCFLSLLRTVLK